MRNFNHKPIDDLAQNFNPIQVNHEDASKNYQVIHISESVHFQRNPKSDDDKHRMNALVYNLIARHGEYHSDQESQP